MSRAVVYLLVALGGALGALARVLVGDLVAKRVGTEWPWGTLTINVSGCFVIAFFLGIIAARSLHPGWRYFLPVGFVGAYTTFSTFEYEVQRLVAAGAWRAAAAYVIASNVAGFVAVLLGGAAARLLR